MKHLIFTLKSVHTLGGALAEPLLKQVCSEHEVKHSWYPGSEMKSVAVEFDKPNCKARWIIII